MRRALAGVIAIVAAAAFLPGPSGRAQAGDRIPIAEFLPLPPAPRPVPGPVEEARRRILGPHALDPDYVTMQWVGVSSFIVTIGGHLLLFDAWEIIGLHDGYSPLTRDDLVAIAPEAILVGHGHFDHAADVGYVAGRTGAVVVGSTEICDTAKTDAAEAGRADNFVCAITGNQSNPPPGTAQAFRLFADVEPVTVLQHVHSAARPPSADNELDPFLPVFDPQPYLEHLNTDPAETARFLAALNDPQGGTWMYHLRRGNFALLVGDSSGPIFEHPQVAAALDAFPGCVDVLANAILGFDQPVSGLQDPRLYVEHAHPRVFLPTHADSWAPVISAGQARYRDEWAAQMAELDNPPEIDFLVDPGDYLVERAYRVDDARWIAPMPGSSCAALTPSPSPGAPASPPTPRSVSPGRPGGALPATGGGGDGVVLIGVALAAIVARHLSGRRPAPRE